jgi:FAD dependent oxidoreductase TIGR03364
MPLLTTCSNLPIVNATPLFDVIVIGAGIVGLAHAHAAAGRGLKVCVIERDAACVGASIRNFGLVTVTGQAPGDTWRRAMHAREVWLQVAPQAGIEIIHQHLWLPARRPEAHAVLDAFMRTPMGEACRLLDTGDARARAPALNLDDARSVLFSPHELRVESRTAIGRLTRWLAEAHGVVFRFAETVHEVEAPRVRTSRGMLQAERVVVCTNAELHGLFAERIAQHELTLCQLQMLRVKSGQPMRLPGSVMTELSLVRYEGFSTLPEAAPLLARLRSEEADSLAHGVHLIAVQSADGSLVVGDSHHDGAAPEPFAMEAVDRLILRHLQDALRLPSIEVTERWTGVYPRSRTRPCIIDAPNEATRLVLVTSGSGASTAFGIAEEVFDAW